MYELLRTPPGRPNGWCSTQAYPSTHALASAGALACIFFRGDNGFDDQVDDVVDATPIHFFCGIWGVIAASLFATKDNCECLMAVPLCGSQIEAFTGMQNGSMDPPAFVRPCTRLYFRRRFPNPGGLPKTARRSTCDLCLRPIPCYFGTALFISDETSLARLTLQMTFLLWGRGERTVARIQPELWPGCTKAMEIGLSGSQRYVECWSHKKLTRAIFRQEEPVGLRVWNCGEVLNRKPASLRNLLVSKTPTSPACPD